MSLSIDVGGVGFKNPCLLAAGVLGTTASSLNRVVRSGAGGVISKSISLNPKPGNKGPVISKTSCGWINSMGLPNPGVDEFIDELDRFSGDVPIVGSVYGSSPSEFKEVSNKIADYVDVVELNLSCPNVEGGIICKDPDLVYRYTKNVKSSVNKPVWVKLSPNVNNISEVAVMAEKADADGVVAINTLTGMVIDIDTELPVLGNQVGGVSGDAIHPIAVNAVYQITKNIDIPVIGVGGISNWKTAVEMILAGAHAIQIGSAVNKNINIFQEINKGIKQYMKNKNYKKITEFRGNAHKK
ncbi:Dihydroorotate dehydrogenase, PyrD [Methanonatronarchaeum thermophilum]|uniref:Dihydroorotate dehydrogenase n=1 Tax=Methanonatronarchaeum thermophilum TaxID=1927129 RepID=A0A1Y3GJC1_9EURY|nr:dihydroorotate dehydrogenase [Methanonatronarchaeum thermophilum]OUJ19486.1 Dihydroorotate dehydrogenase, PyrD [Methanonatronarchaeum thermophilum]